MNLYLVFNRSYRNKSHKRNNFQRKKNPNKYYHIFRQQGHITNECHYNGRTNGTMNQSKFNNNNNKFNKNNKNYRNSNKKFDKNYKNCNNYINNIKIIIYLFNIMTT